MSRSFAVWLGAAGLLLCFGSGFVVGCDDEFESTTRKPMDPFAPNYDAVVEVDAYDPSGQQHSQCPENEPRDGETCPTINEATVITCKYTQRQCQSPNGPYNVTNNYCCSRGGIWVACGVDNPCAAYEVDAAEPTPP